MSQDYIQYFYEGSVDLGGRIYKDSDATIPVDNAWYMRSVGGGELGNKLLIQTNNGIIINNAFSCSDFISSSSSSSFSSSSSSSLSSSSSSSSGLSSSSSSSSVIIPIDLELIQVFYPSV